MFHCEAVCLLLPIRYSTKPESFFRIQSTALAAFFLNFNQQGANFFSSQTDSYSQFSRNSLLSRGGGNLASAISVFHLRTITRTHNRVHICRAASAFAYDDSLFHEMRTFFAPIRIQIHNITQLGAHSVEFYYASSANRVIHQRHDSASNCTTESAKKDEWRIHFPAQKCTCVIDYIVLVRMPRNARVRASGCACMFTALYTNRDMSWATQAQKKIESARRKLFCVNQIIRQRGDMLCCCWCVCIKRFYFQSKDGLGWQLLLHVMVLPSPRSDFEVAPE